MKAELVKVEGEKTIYTHAYLHSAANWALEQATKSEEGSFYNCMCSIIMTAFCIEAYLNYIGMNYIDDWDEKAPPLEKLKVITEEVGIEVDYGRRPFQSVKIANKFRNQMAHGKTAKLSDSYIRKLRAKSKYERLSTWWERQCTVDRAQQLFDDLEKVMELIAESYNLDIPHFGLLSLETHHTKPK